jgi:hypothetical protein
MKAFLRIAYWLLALALVSAILTSLDYTLSQAILISMIFGPCALGLEYLLPKAKTPLNKVYLSLAFLVGVILLILILHEFVWTTITQEGYHTPQKEVSPMLINPAFLGVILIVLSLGDYHWGLWLSKRYKCPDCGITFFSDRKSVTLKRSEIAYIESNDTEVRVVSVTGEAYRNKTGITQWENLLGDGFLRIHRSYLVNVDLASLTAPDTVTVGTVQLPVSRKYKDATASLKKD